MDFLKNINKIKLFFSFIIIIGSLYVSLKLYNNQNFQEYTKISVTYNNQPFESHRNFIKIFRNLKNYEIWVKSENPTSEIFDFINEGSFSSEKGYVTNSNLEFPELRETESTYFIIIKKTSNENLRSVKEYIEYTASKVEEKYVTSFPLYNVAVSFPSKYYRKNFKPATFYIGGSLIFSLFFLAIIFFLYEEIKALQLLK
tara:strand:+ start:1248 stop:1847 length:600 start_codon:yes stop_codon:yes gene_type:complete